MAVNIGSTAGYMRMDSWVMSYIIQLGTMSFVRRFLNRNNDPCGRMFDQMTQAARSGQANIAEGSARHQTSIETEMKLLDVARASISELAGDFTFLLMMNGKTAWRIDNPMSNDIRNIRLETPVYGRDLQHDMTVHVMNQKQRFDPWIEHESLEVAANALLVLCSRVTAMLTHQLEARLQEFKVEGGFAENMTRERLSTIRHKSIEENAPTCPRCGAPMERKYTKRGTNQQREFWGCTKYRENGCLGTRRID